MPLPVRKKKEEQKPVGFIKGFFQKRKQEKEDKLEEMAQMVGNDLVKNAKEICSVLESVQPDSYVFTQEEIDDIDSLVFYVCDKLRNPDEGLYSDIRQIDERIIKIAYFFQEAVRAGSKRVINYCTAAFMNIVDDVRIEIPQIYANRPRDYINTMCAYLDRWLLLIEFANSTDNTQRMIDKVKAENEQAKNKVKESIEAFEKEIRDSKDIQAVVARIDADKRDEWGDVEWNFHKRLVDQRLSKYSANVSEQYLYTLTTELSMNEAKMDQLSNTVAGIPIVVDPLLEQRRNDEMNKFIQEMYETDAKVEESLTKMEEEEGMLQQLKEAPGHTKIVEMAQNELYGILDSMQKEQQNHTVEAADSIKKRFNIMSTQELEEAKARQEQRQREIEEAKERLKAKQQAQAEVQTSQQQETTEREVIYN